MKSAFFAAALLIGTAAIAQPTTTETTDTQTVAPGNTNPETDARGIPVISAPAVAPAGWNAPLGQATAPASGPAPSMGAATDLPPCSRTVTDRCVQTYERGARPR
ncbi:MAG TPA: hypothetical protein VEW25_12140 [Allosphingosinicella sp.]|nr:hypothetical protein [Allosphingosinicella sp.]